MKFQELCSTVKQSFRCQLICFTVQCLAVFNSSLSHQRPHESLSQSGRGTTRAAERLGQRVGARAQVSVLRTGPIPSQKQSAPDAGAADPGASYSNTASGTSAAANPAVPVVSIRWTSEDSEPQQRKRR